MANSYAAVGATSTVMASVRGSATGSGDNYDPQATPQHDLLADAAAGLSTRDVLRRLGPYLADVRTLLAWALAATVAFTLLQLAVPILIGDIIDLMVGPGQFDPESLIGPLRILALVTTGAAFAQGASGYVMNRLSWDLVFALRRDAFDKLARLPISLIDAQPHGDLLARIAVDVDQVGDGVLQGLTQLLSGIVAIVGTLGFMLSISPQVTLLVIVLTPLSVFAAWAIAHFSSASFSAQQALQGSLTGLAAELVDNHQLVSAFAHERQSERAFNALNDELLVAGERAQFVSSLANPSTRLVNGIIYAIVAVVGCAGVVTGWPSALTVGQVQSLLSYANKYMVPFNQISSVVTQIEAAFASAKRVFALLDAEEEVEAPAPDAAPDAEPDASAHEPTGDAEEEVEAPAPDAAPTTLATPIEGDLVFDHVSFSYDKERPLLTDISFHAMPGQKIALVGPTGCGKTTLINLLLRFYDADEGTILVDDVDISALSRDELRAAFGMVLQDTWLFEGTVRDNIAYARPDATQAEVERAARRAHADRFIRQLPQGYDTRISEDGGSLSQGQRQLLSIARVMLANPPMLLLDEATSSIDTRTEREVADAFDRMMLGRTSLVVAHRLSTIRSADCILVMTDGQIVERGTHDELIARGGLYATLYNSQFST